MGVLRVLDTSGHVEHTWDSPEEAAVVSTVFDRLRSEGMLGVRMDASGSGQVLQSFDASAGSILMVPLLRGG